MKWKKPVLRQLDWETDQIKIQCAEYPPHRKGVWHYVRWLGSEEADAGGTAITDDRVYCQMERISIRGVHDRAGRGGTGGHSAYHQEALSPDRGAVWRNGVRGGAGRADHADAKLEPVRLEHRGVRAGMSDPYETR